MKGWVGAWIMVRFISKLIYAYSKIEAKHDNRDCVQDMFIIVYYTI